MVIAIYQMQRKTSDCVNYGSIAMQGQHQGNLSYQANRSYNTTNSDFVKHNSAQLGNKIVYSQSFHNQKTHQQQPHNVRNSSPTRNDPRQGFPIFALKTLGSHPIFQSSRLEAKELPSPCTPNTFQRPSKQGRQKTISEYYRNTEEQILQSPTRVRRPINEAMQQPASSIDMPSSSLRSFSPVRNVVTNNSLNNENVYLNLQQKCKPVQNILASEQENLSSSDGLGTTKKTPIENNNSVYHSVIMSDTKKQQVQNSSSKNNFYQQKNMKNSSLFTNQAFNNIMPSHNFASTQQQKQQYSQKQSESDKIYDCASPLFSMPIIPLTNNKIQHQEYSGSEAVIAQTERLNIQNSSSISQGPSFLKKYSQEKNIHKKNLEDSVKIDRANQIQNTSTAENFYNTSKPTSKQRKQGTPSRPANLTLKNSNSKIKNNSLQGKLISNSNSNSNLKIIDSPLKLSSEKKIHTNSTSNLFLNLESPLKLDKMKNLVNKKNSNVNSRKLDEFSPEQKILKQRQTLEETPRETPRTSVTTQNINGLQKKPELIFEVSKVVDGDPIQQVTTSERQIEIDDFQIVEKIGKGTYGDVFLAQDRQTKFLCVIKALSKKKIKEMQLEQHVFREIKIQFYLNHRHLTSLFGVFDDKNKIYLVMEFMPDGNMSSNGKKKIKEDEAAYLLQQVCEGLLYMHREDIIHRDIKPENLLMNNHYVKIGDFGTSVFGNQMRRTVVGCLAYISPEQLTSTPYDDKIDAWSTGILAYELLIGKPPFEEKIRHLTTKMYDGEPIENIKKRIEERADFPELTFPQQMEISQEAKDFIQRLLEPDPFLRPDLKWALKHKFIQKGREYQNYLDSQL